MQISGTGITPFTVKVLPDYRPMTRLSLEWKKLASGNYYATDRGADADIYEADIQIYGKASVIDDFIEQIELNRQAGSNAITLSNFFSTETIFGENVDHSGSITATVVSFGKKVQARWKSYTLSMRVRTLSPSFVGSASLPTLQYLEVGYEGDNDLSILKTDTYNNTFTYTDREADAGIFKGTFLFSNADMKLIRNYIRIQRSADISITDIAGVTLPFGNRRQTGYTATVKILDWKDLGRWGLQYQRMSLTLAEVV